MIRALAIAAVMAASTAAAEAPVYRQPAPTRIAESDRLVAASQSSWLAFQCSFLAGLAFGQDESDKYFRAAYAQGREFIGAAFHGDISQRSWRSDVPIEYRTRATGPSIDFALGRVMELAVQKITAELLDARAGQEMGSVVEWTDVDRARAAQKIGAAGCLSIRTDGFAGQ